MYLIPLLPQVFNEGRHLLQPYEGAVLESAFHISLSLFSHPSLYTLSLGAQDVLPCVLKYLLWSLSQFVLVFKIEVD